jgi:streptomycin 6-kinase
VRDGAPIETHTSRLLPVRHRGQPAMLKLLKRHSDERAGADLLRYFNGHGAVRVLAADHQALLMERASDDVSLATMALSGEDERAAEILASCVRQLHAPRDVPPPPGLVPITDWFRSLFARQEAHPILSRCAAAARRLLADPRDVTVLHGDLHHMNVLNSPRGWLAIDPKGLLGERTYDVANLLGNPWPHGALVHSTDRMGRLSALYADRLGLDVARVLGFGFAHAGLAASWAIEDGRDPSFRLACAACIAPLLDTAA